jgi:UDP-N-acetylglucosamine--N-acetylmuramyl-(pentapeptide) pyrophosphoryl-undecaprenol N-acetylglucosamine transferase
MTSVPQLLVVLAAGGTGGHVFPAEALAAELRKRELRLALLTDRRGDSFGGALGDAEIHNVRSGGIAGQTFAARLRAGSELALGFFQARSLLKRLSPRAVVGFGGYPSVPTMLAAASIGYPTLIHEQNAMLGRANRLLAGRVTRIATVFGRVAGLPAGADRKLICTGMPVRTGFSKVRQTPYAAVTRDAPIRLLILGGSQGARVFSDVVPDAIERLPDALRSRLDVSQQCRPEDLDRVRAAYHSLGVRADLATFFDNVPERLAAAQLVIARSGASTVAELMAVGRPAILVPYPHAIDDHQSANAKAVGDAGAAWVVPQDSFLPEASAELLENLLTQPQSLESAAACARVCGNPDAAVSLADVVCGLLEPNGADGTAEKGRKAA